MSETRRGPNQTPNPLEYYRQQHRKVEILEIDGDRMLVGFENEGNGRAWGNIWELNGELQTWELVASGDLTVARERFDARVLEREKSF